MYEKFLNDSDIGKILDNINEIHKDALMSCHGRGHAIFVAETTEYVLKELGCGARTVELGKIAGFLHDIGVIAGRWRHARKSAALVKVLLGGADFITPEEKATIIQAVRDHSKGNNITSEIGAALLIADKTDLSRRRIFDRLSIDKTHKNLLEVKDVKLEISDTTITINYVTTENFSREVFMHDFQIEYTKGYIVPQKAAAFLNRACRFEINGEEVVF